MDPMRALENLNQACGQLALTREQHLILAKSVEVIRAALQHPASVPDPNQVPPKTLKRGK